MNEQLLKQHFAADRPSKGGIDADQEIQLPKDEMNAFRYASGYVPMKLLKKYETRKELGEEGGTV